MTVPDPETALRDAACLILLETRGAATFVYMGRRPVTQLFMPDKWVFPGGRVDAGDLAAASAVRSEPATGWHSALLPFALAAIRETAEETGLVVGRDFGRPLDPVPAPGWETFHSASIEPLLGALQPVARAITPPGRVRRYDTWFFAVDQADVHAREWTSDGELLDAAWFDEDNARALDMPPITRLVFEDALAWRSAGQQQRRPPRVPFYAQGANRYERRLIDPATLVVAP
jgi:8-oxo-dGTP pyrophosphatase MutT (NUDIX family)